MPYWYFIWLILTFWQPRPVAYTPLPEGEQWIPARPPVQYVVQPPCVLIRPGLSVCP